MKAFVLRLIRWILDNYIDTLDAELRVRGKHIHENPKKGKVSRTRKPKVEVANDQG